MILYKKIVAIGGILVTLTSAAAKCEEPNDNPAPIEWEERRNNEPDFTPPGEAP